MFQYSCHAMVFTLVGAVLAAGCNSQIDDLGPVVVRASSATPGGIYRGSMTPQLSSTQTPVVALVDNLDSQQHFILYSDDGSRLSSGLLTTVGNGVSGQARSYDLSGADATSQTLSFTGNYLPQSELGGAYSRMSASAGTGSGTVLETGQLSLDYQAAVYETRSALALLQGVWSNVDAFGMAQTSFSLDSNGGVFGQVLATGCTYNGSIALIDLRVNLYSITKLTETCGSSGILPLELSGLATLLPASATTGGKPQLVLAVAAPSAARLFRLSPGS